MTEQKMTEDEYLASKGETHGQEPAPEAQAEPMTLIPAPSVVKEAMEAKIAQVFYSRASARMTVCIITMINGFEVLGQSSCVSEENFDQEIGERLAYENALDKIWELEGYLLREQLFVAGQLNMEGAFLEALKKQQDAAKAEATGEPQAEPAA